MALNATTTTAVTPISTYDFEPSIAISIMLGENPATGAQCPATEQMARRLRTALAQSSWLRSKKRKAPADQLRETCFFLTSPFYSTSQHLMWPLTMQPNDEHCTEAQADKSYGSQPQKSASAIGALFLGPTEVYIRVGI